MAQQTVAQPRVLRWRIARCLVIAERSLLESVKRQDQLRAVRWTVQARDFAPKTVLPMKSSLALLCLAQRPVVEREFAPEALASNQIAAQAASLLAQPALLLFSGA